MDEKNNYNINYSWTQPYLPTSYNPFYERSPKSLVSQEMGYAAAADRRVAMMNTYPDAEEIINKIKNNS